ncbi:hypothetical protein ZYGR_0H05380 [Zygosaccharomyces rouxii]|uniref:ZYRO0B16434p n=2 Tax=Zygosaccharomyces rouxii TaxID=4956 RepID=C5DSF4_ZYGRC|nr:uncharacterized protein ZYRO0B16434g [Zygosaccharomyces rouxii]GAV47692.1 hypothetical protein ZYGR_0H05380 [Zygosaccharomyces rouxii]CAR26715.1 ZYRO0B16434p [Zygosaccharomyces rouxii]
MDRKGSDLYRDARSKNPGALRLSQLAYKSSSLLSTRKNLPLESKNVNVTSLCGSKKIEHASFKRKPLSSINQKSYVVASQESNNAKPLDSILQNSKVSKLSQPITTTNIARGEDIRDSYTLRRRIRDDNEKCASSADKKKTNLVTQLICALNDFNLMVKTSQQNQNYDILVDIRHAIWLSPFEIMVISDDPRVKRAILHSHKAIPKFVNSPSRLAICSKCCLTLYNDMNWYLKWKFL